MAWLKSSSPLTQRPVSPAYKLPVPIRPARGAALASDGRGAPIDSRMLVLLRCVLALSGLLLIWVAPGPARSSVTLTVLPLATYLLFSITLAYYSYRSGWPAPPRAMHWIDVFFCAYVVAVSEAGNSFFFLFFFYPILVSSFSMGFREGMLVTVASMALFVVEEFALLTAVGRFEPGRTVIHTAYLGIFGYMIAYLGGYEHMLRRELALLKEINNQWNPRFGVDHVNGVNLDRLLQFYNADSCVLMLRRPAAVGPWTMYCAIRNRPGHAATPSNLVESIADALMRLPETLAAYYHDAEGPWWMRYRGHAAIDFESGERTNAYRDECATWINLLDTRAFVSVPYAQRDGTRGRLFVTAANGWFTSADIDYLGQASDAMSTVIENMYLVEELIEGAAERERLSISRDLHDTTIQPYIGLKLALDALHRDAGAANPRLSQRISEIIDMADMTVRDLRNYATTLKENAPLPGSFLVAAVQKQTERLSRFYGIKVEVKSDISPRLKGRLAAEAFQIISEGLSNVLRHTSSKQAFVTILCEEDNLLLEIGNEAGAGVAKFTPRSISERAQALGGKAFVEQQSDRYTVVHVTIPM